MKIFIRILTCFICTDQLYCLILHKSISNTRIFNPLQSTNLNSDGVDDECIAPEPEHFYRPSPMDPEYFNRKGQY